MLESIYNCTKKDYGKDKVDIDRAARDIAKATEKDKK